MRFANEILLLWLACCAWTDWRRRCVPNALSYGMVVAAVLCLLLVGQTLLGQPAWVGWNGGLVAAVLVLPGFLSHRLGGGDVKLLIGLGLATGPMVTLLTLVGAVPFLLLLRHTLSGPDRLPLVPALLGGYGLARGVLFAGWL